MARQDRCQLWHKKVILEFMGVPVTDIKNLNQKTADVMMEAAKSDNPTKFSRAFKIVVNKEIPENATVEEKGLGITAHMIEEKICELESAAINRISVHAIGKINNVETHFLEALENAKKQVMKTVLEIKTPGKVKLVKGVLPECFQDIVELASARINIFLTGPAGCGKTYVAAKVAEALDLEFASQSCSAGMSESILAGWLLPVSEGGKFTYVSSEFVRIYEHGGVFLFDEIDAADANTLLFLNTALANGYFTIPQRYEKPRVEKHPDFVAIAAANTFGNGADSMYSGRNSLDAATMDRFRCGMIQMDYSPKIENELVNSELLHWALPVRRAIRDRNLQKILSTRFLLDGTKMMQAGWTLDKVKKSFFVDWSREEKLLIGER